MFNSSMQLTSGDILTLLIILAVILVIVILFNIIFVSVSLRRVARRADRISKEAEAIVIKPLQTADAAIDWIVSFLQGWTEEKETKKKHGKHHKHEDVIDA